MKEDALKFQASLQSFDPLLSLRWGSTVGQWVVQRRSLIPDAEMKFLQNERGRLWKRIEAGKASQAQKDRYNGLAEEHECALLGKRVIIFVKDFSSKVFDTLALWDIKRYGGYSRYTDKSDELVAQQDAMKDHEAENKRAIIHSESWGRHGIYEFLMRKKQTQIHQFGIRDMRTLLGTEVFKGLK
jgi:hypothetical protein